MTKYNMESILFTGPTREQQAKMAEALEADRKLLESLPKRELGQCYKTFPDGTCSAWDCKLHGDPELQAKHQNKAK